MPAILERATGSITTSVDDVNAVNEVQTIELNDIGAADTFTLTYGGQTTSTITFNATPATFAADIQTKLLALSNIGPADVTVTATDGNSMVVTFVGDLRGRQVTQITITDVAGFTPTGVTATTPGRSAVTRVLGGGTEFYEVLRVRVGLFENSATNDISIKDAAAHTILVKTGLDFDVSGVKYDEWLGCDGVDQAGNASADVARGIFEGMMTCIIKTDAPASGSLQVVTRGGALDRPRYRKRGTGTLTTDGSGDVVSSINLGSAFGIVRRVVASGFDTSCDLSLVDAWGKNIFVVTSIDPDTSDYDKIVGGDGLDQDGNAAANLLPMVARGPLTVTIANGGATTTGSVRVYTEN